MNGSLESDFRRLFQKLNQAGYAWEPLEPGHVRAAIARDREGRDVLPPLLRRFGLGIGREPDSPLVARVENHFVAHNGGRVYLGPESSRLAGLLRERAELFRGKRALDLGSGAGALSFAISDLVTEVLGLELSEQAVHWATASARAQGVTNVSFIAASLGTRAAEDAVARSGPWEVAFFNPPMAIPSPGPSGQRPERDGGALGIEIPRLFLDFARRSLTPGGRVLFLATSPVLRDGREPFFDGLDDRWDFIEKKRLHADFNRALFRQDNYASLGVTRAELWFLHACKRPATPNP